MPKYLETEKGIFHIMRKLYVVQRYEFKALYGVDQVGPVMFIYSGALACEHSLKTEATMIAY